jgi:FAD:protein FMN transferase
MSLRSLFAAVALLLSGVLVVETVAAPGVAYAAKKKVKKKKARYRYKAPADPAEDPEGVGQASTIILAEGLMLARKSRPVFGVLSEVAVVYEDTSEAPKPKKAPQTVTDAIDAAFDAMDKVSENLGEWRGRGDIDRLNRGAGKGPLSISDSTAETFDRVGELVRATGGRFDPTVATCAPLWKFTGENAGIAPTAAELAPYKNLVGWGQLLRTGPHGTTVSLPAVDQHVSLTGYLRGALADAGAMALKKRGYANYLVTSGGKAVAAGPFRGAGWRFGIQNPRKRGTHIGHLLLADKAIASRGDYEAFVVTPAPENARLHRLLDPSTCEPTKRAQFAMVTHDNAATAEAWATALMVAGPVEGLDLAGKTPGLEALIVGSDGIVHMTDGLKTAVALEPTVHQPQRRATDDGDYEASTW